MRDSTNIIKVSIATNIVWSINFFFSVIEKIQEIRFEISYWKDEENWASIIFNDQTIGYVWKKYPLIFIVSDYAEEIKNHLKEDDYITYIEMSSLIDKKFQINYDELKNDIDFGLTSDEFSAEDFWFHTNSV